MIRSSVPHNSGTDYFKFFIHEEMINLTMWSPRGPGTALDGPAISAEKAKDWPTPEIEISKEHGWSFACRFLQVATQGAVMAR